MKKLLFVLSICGVLASCQNSTNSSDATQNSKKQENKHDHDHHDHDHDAHQKSNQAKAQPQANAEQAKIDDDLIQKYLSEKGIKAQKTPEGVYYVITKEGDGNHPTINDYVNCHYRGYLLNGNEFDSSYSRNQPAKFPLKGVVKGWQIGIPKISTGGKATLFIPSQLGYGARAIGDKIPSNSVLLFDVELLDIQTK